MLSIQETIEISNIFVDQIFLELLATIFDTFLFEHTVYIEAALYGSRYNVLQLQHSHVLQYYLDP